MPCELPVSNSSSNEFIAFHHTVIGVIKQGLNIITVIYSVNGRFIHSTTGIPVINPRHQLFHSTIARVVADEYPVDAVVPRIHAAVPEFASFHMTVFEVAGELIYAKP